MAAAIVIKPMTADTALVTPRSADSPVSGILANGPNPSPPIVPPRSMGCCAKILIRTMVLARKFWDAE